MNFLKYLISFILATTPVAAAEETDGWVTVNRTLKKTERVEEEDASIWVLVLKEFGAETVQVRFPTDPKMRVIGDQVYELTAENGDETYQLTVEPAGDGPLPVTDLLYPSEGKWIQEHFVQTKDHFFRFKTTSSTPKNEGHELFCSSFSIEKNR
jgi:hypothetical protein